MSLGMNYVHAPNRKAKCLKDRGSSERRTLCGDVWDRELSGFKASRMPVCRGCAKACKAAS